MRGPLSLSSTLTSTQAAQEMGVVKGPLSEIRQQNIQVTARYLLLSQEMGPFLCHERQREVGQWRVRPAACRKLAMSSPSKQQSRSCEAIDYYQTKDAASDSG